MTANLIRSVNYTLRLRPHEMEAIRRAAKKERMVLSEFVRRVMLDAAQRRLTRSGRSE